MPEHYDAASALGITPGKPTTPLPPQEDPRGTVIQDSAASENRTDHDLDSIMAEADTGESAGESSEVFADAHAEEDTDLLADEATQQEQQKENALGGLLSNITASKKDERVPQQPTEGDQDGDGEPDEDDYDADGDGEPDFVEHAEADAKEGTDLNRDGTPDMQQAPQSDTPMAKEQRRALNLEPDDSNTTPVQPPQEKRLDLSDAKAEGMAVVGEIRRPDQPPVNKRGFLQMQNRGDGRGRRGRGRGGHEQRATRRR